MPPTRRRQAPNRYSPEPFRAPTRSRKRTRRQALPTPSPSGGPSESNARYDSDTADASGSPELIDTPPATVQAPVAAQDVQDAGVRRSSRNRRAPSRYSPELHTPQPRQRRPSPTPLEPDERDADDTDDEPLVENDVLFQDQQTALATALRELEAEPERHYLGPMNDFCPACQAKHWKEERSSRKPPGSPTNHRLCCGFGTVDLEPFPSPPPTLRHLMSTTDADGVYSLGTVLPC